MDSTDSHGVIEWLALLQEIFTDEWTDGEKLALTAFGVVLSGFLAICAIFMKHPKASWFDIVIYTTFVPLFVSVVIGGMAGASSEAPTGILLAIFVITAVVQWTVAIKRRRSNRYWG